MNSSLQGKVALGHQARGIVADVSKLPDLDRVYAEIGRAADRLDIVFANAGGGDMMPLSAIASGRPRRS